MASTCTNCTSIEDEKNTEQRLNKRPNQDNEISILEYEKSIYASSRNGGIQTNQDEEDNFANFNADYENFSTKRRIT